MGNLTFGVGQEEVILTDSLIDNVERSCLSDVKEPLPCRPRRKYADKSDRNSVNCLVTQSNGHSRQHCSQRHKRFHQCSCRAYLRHSTEHRKRPATPIVHFIPTSSLPSPVDLSTGYSVSDAYSRLECAGPSLNTISYSVAAITNLNTSSFCRNQKQIGEVERVVEAKANKLNWHSDSLKAGIIKRTSEMTLAQNSTVKPEICLQEAKVSAEKSEVLDLGLKYQTPNLPSKRLVK
ncbi:unnamed protein product, partial [Protopolystoma xenopodis]